MDGCKALNDMIEIDMRQSFFEANACFVHTTLCLRLLLTWYCRSAFTPRQIIALLRSQLFSSPVQHINSNQAQASPIQETQRRDQTT